MMKTGLFPKAPAYTLEGFSKAKIPESLFRKLQRFNSDLPLSHRFNYDEYFYAFAWVNIN
jgi:hypothetical protein